MQKLILKPDETLFIALCSKEKRDSPDGGEKKYPVKFDVSGFTQIYEPQGGAIKPITTLV